MFRPLKLEVNEFNRPPPPLEPSLDEKLSLDIYLLLEIDSSPSKSSSPPTRELGLF
jgi:hypothetical protein